MIYTIHGEQISPEACEVHRVTLTTDTVIQVTALNPTAIPHDAWYDHVVSWLQVMTAPRYAAAPLARFRRGARARELRAARRAVDIAARRAESAWEFEA